MTIEEYFLDNNENEISITVTVSTPGIARTEIEITYPNDKTEIKANSNDGTGLIAKKNIGKASELLDCLVEIDTDILLNKIPKSDWQNCFDNLVIKYYLDGGIAGKQQIFECTKDEKHKSVSGKTIGAEKYIFLTKK